MAELAALAGRDLAGVDLHRPQVDEVGITCPTEHCGAPASRLPPVLDAWFDSGSMPSAEHHYPFEGVEPFESTFPADFICEGIDQTRGWFYSLLAVNTLVFDSAPYRNVVCLNLVVDAQGQKMSKSRGNVLDPWAIFGRHGSDALRWYFFSAGSPWTTRRVSDDGIVETARATLLTLWNVFAFFVLYADLDGWSPPAFGVPDAAPTHVLDRWILSELDRTTDAVTTALEGFDALAAASRLTRFVDDLSNWYVRRSRRRFWKRAEAEAHATLHHVLTVTAQLLAPFCPLLAEEIFTTLTGETSVHLSDWPVASGAEDDLLAARMAAGRRLVALGRAARTDAKVKVRQPLRRALLLHPGTELDDAVRAEIREELNVRALEDVDTLSGLMSWEVVPNFRVLGPRLGAAVGDVKAALAEADGSALRRALEADGHLEVAGVRLYPGDVEVRATRHDSFALAEDAGWAVALDSRAGRRAAPRGHGPRARPRPSTTSARSRVWRLPIGSASTWRAETTSGPRSRPTEPGSRTRCSRWRWRGPRECSPSRWTATWCRWGWSGPSELPWEDGARPRPGSCYWGWSGGGSWIVRSASTARMPRTRARSSTASASAVPVITPTAARIWPSLEPGPAPRPAQRGLRGRRARRRRRPGSRPTTGSETASRLTAPDATGPGSARPRAPAPARPRRPGWAAPAGGRSAAGASPGRRRACRGWPRRAAPPGPAACGVAMLVPLIVA